jgi:hypothetical protein
VADDCLLRTTGSRLPAPDYRLPTTDTLAYSYLLLTTDNRLPTRPLADFFRGNPMAFYGSTAMSFAASFGLTTVVVAVLEHDREITRRTDRLRDEHAACHRTGLLPLHCAVANGQAQMFDFLTGE